MKAGLCSVVILISGRGSNLQAILDQAASGDLPIDIRAVISNRPEAAGLALAEAAGVPTESLDHRQFASREDFDRALQQTIDRFQPQLVVLAGFMRILTADFVHHYRGRLLNIHPSLLPKYQGLDTHRRVLENGEREHGVSVHFVTEELDGGPVIAQSRVNVLPDDSPEQLAARVLEKEHRLYPAVIRWFAEGRLRLAGDQVIFDGQAQTEPVCIE